MNNSFDLPKNLVIAIYKGKFLLTSKDSYSIPQEKNAWSFLDTNKTKELGTKTESIESYDRKFCYIKLTDENVFSITRNSGSRLEFYGPSEFEKIRLSTGTKQLYMRYKEEIEKILAD